MSVMNESFSLGLSSSLIQDEDYMSLLSESLAIVDYTKALKGDTIDNEIKHNRLYFRGKQMSVCEKMECFNRLVFERSLLLDDLCFDCLNDFVKVCHFSQKRYESYAQNYEENIVNLTTNKNNNGKTTSNQNDQNDHKKDNISNNVDEDVDEDVAQSLVEEVKGLRKANEELLNDEKILDEKLLLLDERKRQNDEKLFDEMKSLHLLQYKYDDISTRVQDMYVSSVSTEQEIHLLSSPQFVPLFKLDLLVVSPSLASNVPPGYLVPTSPRDVSGVVLAVNGFRVAYSPRPEYNLNWAEINAGWANMCTAFSCFQHFIDDTTALGEARSSGMGDPDVAGGSLLYSFDIMCLRNTGILVESMCRRKMMSGRSNASMSKNRHQPMSFCLNYSESLSSTGSTNVRRTRIEYTYAILALAIVVIEVSVLNCRLDIMTSFTKINFLYAYSKPRRIKIDNQIYVDILEWPSIDQLLSLPEFRNESDLRALVDDVLMSIYCILKGPPVYDAGVK